MQSIQIIKLLKKYPFDTSLIVRDKNLVKGTDIIYLLNSTIQVETFGTVGLLQLCTVKKNKGECCNFTTANS